MVLHVFTVIGDSNVGRFVTLTNRRACPDLKEAQVIVCGKLPLFKDRLEEVRRETTVCILACTTNFMTESTSAEASTASIRIEANLLALQQSVLEACSRHQGVSFMVCPPMYRSAPLWYRDGLSEILGKFSSVISKDRPSNLHMMPSFPSPSFDQDGIHLSPSSGLEYLYHLFDSAREVLMNCCPDLPEKSSLGTEATRLLEDRVMALEQDHRRLNKNVEFSAAVAAEREDFQENVRNEVFFMISGLTAIQGLRGKEWMTRAIADVQAVIRVVLGKELPIVVVHNATGRPSGSEVRYSVKMETAAASQEIRGKFGSFFVGGQDRRPDALRTISISNKITPGTQIRLMLLKLLAKRYLTSNPGSRTRVIGYEARPLLKITPPETVSKKVKIYNFIEAVTKLPTCFTPAEIQPILSKARIHFRGSIRSTFIVLSDDDAAGSATLRARELDNDADDEPEPEVVSVDASTASRKRPSSTSAGSQPDSQRARI